MKVQTDFKQALLVADNENEIDLCENCPLTEALRLAVIVGDSRHVSGLWTIIERKHPFKYFSKEDRYKRIFEPSLKTVSKMTETEFLTAYPTKSVHALGIVRSQLANAGLKFRVA